MESRRRIAFVPGAFRPFGDHHMRMVKHYADMCDEVVVVISNPRSDEAKRETSCAPEISPEDAKEIVELCVGDSGLGNVTVQVSDDGNPIKTVLKDVALLKDCDVVLGVSSKDGDQDRYSGIDLDYFSGNGVRIVPPVETVFAPEVDDDGIGISASDIRENVQDEEMLKAYLPAFIEDQTFRRICDILCGKSRDRLDSKEEIAANSSIFEELLESDFLGESLSDDADSDGVVDGTLDEEDTEFSAIRLDDTALESAKCSLIAYNTQISEDDGDRAYNPKNNPDKAVDILFEFGDGNSVEIWLDPETKEWCSDVNGGEGTLTPDQFGEYFGTDFQRKVDRRLEEMWPESDPYFRELLGAVRRKKVNVCPKGIVQEDGEFRKGNIDKARSRETNAAGEQIYTNSGRKIVTFSDFGVKHGDKERYFCWPERNKQFKWSQWADWRKIKPVARASFQHLSYQYGISLSPILEDDENRGFRSYNLDLEPKLQYCTPIETSQMLKLTIIQKFLKFCKKRIQRFISIPDEEIFAKVNKPEKCTIDDIRKTKKVMKNCLNAIRNARADTFIYD